MANCTACVLMGGVVPHMCDTKHSAVLYACADGCCCTARWQHCTAHVRSAAPGSSLQRALWHVLFCGQRLVAVYSVLCGCLMAAWMGVLLPVFEEENSTLLMAQVTFMSGQAVRLSCPQCLARCGLLYYMRADAEGWLYRSLGIEWIRFTLVL